MEPVACGAESEQALISSIQVEMKQKSAGDRKYLLIAPGNYGLQYLSGNFTFEAEEAVKCSNYVGQTIDFAVNMGLKGVLFVAHIGKFIKVAGGIMNTHSREADARMEIMAACALRAGADVDTANRILVAVTTDEGLSILKRDAILGTDDADHYRKSGILSESSGTGATGNRCSAVQQCAWRAWENVSGGTIA